MHCLKPSQIPEGLHAATDLQFYVVTDREVKNADSQRPHKSMQKVFQGRLLPLYQASLQITISVYAMYR